MTKYISLFGATTTDTQVQVVKENQVIIGIGAGASRKRYVVYKGGTHRPWLRVPHGRYRNKGNQPNGHSATPLANIRYRQVLRRREPRVHGRFRGGFAREAGGRGKPRRKPSPPPKRKPSMTA